MNALVRAFWALLLAAPAFCQPASAPDPRLVEGRFVWFTLSETSADIARSVGAPQLATAFGRDYQSWQYRFGDMDHDDFSHFFVFHKSSGQLAAVTRSFESEQNVDWMFPGADSAVYCDTASAGQRYCVRARRLGGERFLLAMGVSKPGDLTSQVTLIRASELPVLYPWLARRIETGAKTNHR